MTRFRVVHRTTYVYDRPMADGLSVVHLAPRPTPWQSVEFVAIDVDPMPDEYEVTLDPFGNSVTRFAVHRPHDRLTVEARSEVTVTVPEAAQSHQTVADVVAAAGGDTREDVGMMLASTPATPHLAELDWLAATLQPDRPVTQAVSALCAAIFHGFRFDAEMTDVSTPLADVVAVRHGVCQDFAHVACSVLRAAGLPARYVSGYIETVPPPGQPRLAGVDASHAWCSVWAGELGWLDFDPTNNHMPPLRHVTVGWGRDYHDVAPVRGVVVGPAATQSLQVSVDVSEL